MLGAMARPAITLAALATAAVPGLEVASARPRSTGRSHEFDAAEIQTTAGEALIVRVPRSQRAETDQSTDLNALRALSVGVRQRLPFEVPEYVGQAPIGPTRGIVYRFIPGTELSATQLTADATLAASVGLAIAAIHSLPISVVADAGLPVHSAAEARQAVDSLISDDGNTGHVPAALLRRWDEATDDDALWQFAPTVINGQLAADSFVISGERVNGVLGWSELSVGDPARDVHWLLSARGEYAELALESYRAGRGGNIDPKLARRAVLLGELELARWLLHGVSLRDEAIIADAVGLLDGLVAHVFADEVAPISADTGTVMAVDDVESMLAETPWLPGGESQVSLMTDSFEPERWNLDADSVEPDGEADAVAPAAEALGGSGVAEAVTEDDEPVALPFEPATTPLPGASSFDEDQVSTEPLSFPQRDTNSASS